MIASNHDRGGVPFMGIGLDSVQEGGAVALSLKSFSDVNAVDPEIFSAAGVACSKVVVADANG